jgi:hypothetical protein
MSRLDEIRTKLDEIDPHADGGFDMHWGTWSMQDVTDLRALLAVVDAVIEMRANPWISSTVDDVDNALDALEKGGEQ